MNRDTLEHPRDGALMVLVSAGPFLMGLPDNDLLAEDHEKPQRTVDLPAFWIDVHPVANVRFARFIEAGGYSREEWWAPDGWAWRRKSGVEAPAMWGQSGWDGGDQPAAGVSWYEADAYARWAGKRLPTDAEWEKAARGTDGRRYPWGEDWPHAGVANFDMQVGRTSPVGLYPAGASPCGCLDMAGNVNNWVADWYWPMFGRWCAEHAPSPLPLSPKGRGEQENPLSPWGRGVGVRGRSWTTPSPPARRPAHHGESGSRWGIRHIAVRSGSAGMHEEGPLAAGDARAVERLPHRFRKAEGGRMKDESDPS